MGISPTLLIIIGTISSVSVMLVLLWQWWQHYSHVLSRHGMLLGLENEIQERSEALEGLLKDVERRRMTQSSLLVDVKQRSVEMKLLSEIGEVFHTSHTLAGAQDRIGALLKQLFASQGGAFCVMNDEAKGLRTITTWGEVSLEDVFSVNDCYALQSSTGDLHLFSAQKHSQEFCSHLHYTGATEYLCVPLQVQDEILGLLHLRSEFGQTFNEGTSQLAKLAAEQVALVLANLKIQEKLRFQTVSDPLTGLYNRRYMEESLKREVRRASRNQQPMGIIMLDLDNMQEFNNRFGYDKGDQLLNQLGSFLQTTIRGGDIACRYRNDEFVLILPGASLEVTRQRAEQLRQGVRLLKAQEKSTPAEQLTLSLGVASFPQNGISAEILLHAAKGAMKRAQETGGSSVMVA
jgi:diguanylate cyclase (GGDEF)-like protein